MNQSDVLDLFKAPNAIYTVADICEVFKVKKGKVQTTIAKLAKWGYIEKTDRLGTLAPIYRRL